MSTHITDPDGDQDGRSGGDGGTPSGGPGVPRGIVLAGLITALGGLTGLATLITALTGHGRAGDEGHATAPPSVSATAKAAAPRTGSVRITYPQEAAAVLNHQKFYGVAVIPPHHTLWLIGQKQAETSLYLLQRASVDQGTGKSGEAAWHACPQIGNFPAQRGTRFRITVALVPDSVSDYLLGATTYTGVQLVPAKIGADVAGFVSPRFPPGTDTAHTAAVWVTLTGGGENCSNS
ncbi:hypothetical protein [Streptomyces sp. NPDC057257]|uniref:hypothetical protein n=1 Tax=Streptomyces sp. NPDC057257 TaxID=3346071 RepID=UPI003642F77B